jgi:hypothetical protein
MQWQKSGKITKTVEALEGISTLFFTKSRIKACSFDEGTPFYARQTSASFGVFANAF